MAEGFAPAKINLTLHVTGQRADGYHLLDSLVVFAGVGDGLTAHPAASLSLKVTGPRATGVPTDDRNLVLRAARAMGAGDVAITLDKHLPAAAGIGGGSSDAAAAMRLLSGMTGRPLPADRGLSLGADVPVCLSARPARMSGIGEIVEPVDTLPPFALVLVNPGVAVPTGEVFRRLSSRSNAPMPDLPECSNAATLAEWLATQRNDLESPARALVPAIGEALAGLQASQGCLLARMSGSGATCFGLYATLPQAETAADAIHARHPHWWTAAAPTWRLWP